MSYSRVLDAMAASPAAAGVALVASLAMGARYLAATQWLRRGPARGAQRLRRWTGAGDCRNSCVA